MSISLAQSTGFRSRRCLHVAVADGIGAKGLTSAEEAVEHLQQRWITASVGIKGMKQPAFSDGCCAVGADVAAAEAIDGLLGIADQGQRGMPIEERFKQAPLNRVGVLKFIDQTAAQLPLTPATQTIHDLGAEAIGIDALQQVPEAELIALLPLAAGLLPQLVDQAGAERLNRLKAQAFGAGMQPTGGGLIGVVQHAPYLACAVSLGQQAVALGNGAAGIAVEPAAGGGDQRRQLLQFGFPQQGSGGAAIAAPLADRLKRLR